MRARGARHLVQFTVVGTLIQNPIQVTTASPVVLTPRNRRRHISHAMPLMASLARASPGAGRSRARRGSSQRARRSPDSGCETVTHTRSESPGRRRSDAAKRDRAAFPGSVCARGACARRRPWVINDVGVSRGDRAGAFLLWSLVPPSFDNCLDVSR